jgi:LPPG:FO 2-phospho-L-lactate transferase
VHRSARLREGAPLHEVAAEIARAFGVETRLLPMSNDPTPTRILRHGGLQTDFEEYLVRDGAPDDVVAIDLRAAAASAPAPGVLEALRTAQHILICPSNPVVSIGTIRAVPGVEEELRRRGCAVAVSPIIDGRPVKGPADRLLHAVGEEVSALGVARMYREIACGMVIDSADAPLAGAIEALGLRVRSLPTLMRTPAVARDVAIAALELSAACRPE